VMVALEAGVPSALLISPRSAPAPAADWPNVNWADKNISTRALRLSAVWRRSKFCSIFFLFNFRVVQGDRVGDGRARHFSKYGFSGADYLRLTQRAIVTWVVLLLLKLLLRESIFPILELEMSGQITSKHL
jgi:hypothetical protein